jgi:Tol biopolymer transport system component
LFRGVLLWAAACRIPSLALAALILGGLALLPSRAEAFRVQLQNATATFSQTVSAGANLPVSEAIDGVLTSTGGWAIAGPVPGNATISQTAVFETTTNLFGPGGGLLTFTLHQLFGASHTLGRFRLSVTTDDRSLFADGLQTGGDVTANWTVLDPLNCVSAGGATCTKQGDLSLLISGTLPTTDVYTVTAFTSLAGITGIRLETLTDPSLPVLNDAEGGPGRQPADGNFVLTEFQVDVPSPAPTIRIVRPLGQGLGGAPADGAILNPAVSADGRLVAFQSTATNLVGSGCSSGVGQIFLQDRATQAITCLSVAPSGAPGNAVSSRPAMSGDGRVVAFESAATNLVPSGCRVVGRPAIFVRDRLAGTTACVSVGPGRIPADAPATAPDISLDGTLVVFVSAATNLAAGCPGGVPQIFLRDRAAGTTTCLSVGPGGAQGDGASEEPVLSGDGSVAVFESAARNLVAAGCTTSVRQIFLHDRATGAVSCVSTTAAGAPGDAPSAAPAVSDDGTVLAFESAAQNLASPCATPVLQVFVLQRAPNRLLCISVGPGGPGNGPSFAPAISGDGRTVVFSSEATNLLGAGLGLPGVLAQTGSAGTLAWEDIPTEPITALINGTAPTGERPTAIGLDRTTIVTVTPAPAGTGIAAVDTVPEPPAGQPLIVQPAGGTVFTLVGGIQLTVQWTAVAGATSYRLEFTGPLPAPFTLEVQQTTTFTVTLTSAIPAGTFQVRVIPLSAGGAGTPSSSVAFTLVPGISPAATDRPFFTTPQDGVTVSYNQPVTFAWTPVAGVTQYGFEFTGANLTFANPNGTAADGVNGFGGAGGGFLVMGTSTTVPIPAGIQVGAYQVRVIGFGAAGVVGSFGDALTLTVQP